MQVALAITLTPEELSSGAIDQARAIAATALPNVPGLDKAACQTDLKATAPSTFTFDLTPAAAAK
ncbi:MAG TPA: hypothetical protein VFW87_01905 [Pirellulales bacterium]|nr:hypothetical protein [Pirellulales bacterium]